MTKQRRNQERKKDGLVPLDVLLLREEALEDALLAEGVALGAGERVDERLEAEAAGVEGLDGVLAEPLPLGAVPELPLLLVGEEGEVVVVLRVPLRHLRCASPSSPLPAGGWEARARGGRRRGPALRWVVEVLTLDLTGKRTRRGDGLIRWSGDEGRIGLGHGLGSVPCLDRAGTSASLSGFSDRPVSI